jgi:hypothetical protein
MFFLYIVTYQLSFLRNRAPLIEELQHSPGWWHYLDNTWLIHTGETAEQLYNRIAPKFFQNELFLIVQITPDAVLHGWLPNEAWDWINQQRFRTW